MMNIIRNANGDTLQAATLRSSESSGSCKSTSVFMNESVTAIFPVLEDAGMKFMITL